MSARVLVVDDERAVRSALEVNLTRRGYMLIDVNPTRVVGEWWFVDTVTAPSTNEAFATAFQVETGTNRLSPASQTPARPGAAPLAP